MAVRAHDVPFPHIWRRDYRPDKSGYGSPHSINLRVVHELVQLVPRTQPAGRKDSSLRVNVQSCVVRIHCQPHPLSLLTDEQIQTRTPQWPREEQEVTKEHPVSLSRGYHCALHSVEVLHDNRREPHGHDVRPPSAMSHEAAREIHRLAHMLLVIGQHEDIDPRGEPRVE